MCDRGLFEMEYKLSIDSAWQSSTSRLSLCLQPMDYIQNLGSTQKSTTSRFLSISGFPRELCAQDIIMSPSLEDANEKRAGLAGRGASPSMPALKHAKTAPIGLQPQSVASGMQLRRLMTDPQVPASLDQTPEQGDYGNKLDNNEERTEISSINGEVGSV